MFDYHTEVSKGLSPPPHSGNHNTWDQCEAASAQYVAAELNSAGVQHTFSLRRPLPPVMTTGSD